MVILETCGDSFLWRVRQVVVLVVSVVQVVVWWRMNCKAAGGLNIEICHFHHFL